MATANTAVVDGRGFSKPRLRHCTMLDGGSGGPLRLIVGRSHFDLAETAGRRDDFLRLKSLMDGRHEIEQIADRTGLSVDDVRGVVAAFEDSGLLRHEAPLASIEVEQFLAQVSDTTEMWRRQIGFHPLFQGLAAARFRKEVLQGLFIETFHCVRLCSTHIATAIAHAATDRQRALLSRYLAEEFAHAPLMLATCVNLGCSAEQVEASHPIVATTSLMHMLAEVARTDTLAYAAALALFEAVPGDEVEGENGVQDIARAYDVSPAAFAPAMSHLLEDVSSGHCSMLEEMLAEIDSLPASRAHSIVNLLHDLKHAYDQLHDGIVSYYGDISNYVPRLKVDYFSL